MITTLGLFTLEKAMNAYIALDPDNKDSLKNLNGRVVGFDIQALPMPLLFFIKFNQSGVTLHADFSGHVDTTISGTPLALMKLGLNESAAGTQSAFQHGVRMLGDAEVGTEVKAFFDGIDIDWEEHLSSLVGDIIAHQVGHTVRSLLHWGQDSKVAMQQNLTEYLQEEIQQLPPREEVDDFFADLDTLILDTERAYLRVQNL